MTNNRETIYTFFSHVKRDEWKQSGKFSVFFFNNVCTHHAIYSARKREKESLIDTLI